MALESNFYNIINEIENSKGTISESNYTDVDAQIFAELSGINIEELTVPNSFSYVSGDKSAAYQRYNIDYTPAELVKLYENSYTEEELAENDKYLLLKGLANSERYRDIKLSNFANCADREYTDEEGNTYNVSFKAVTVDLGDTKVIAYAGTGNSIFSWLEDGRMASASKGVGAQVWGKEYAEFVMNMDSDNIMFAGYSKGGNQAIYSSVYLSEEYGDRIKKVINVDGPGFSKQAMMQLIGEKTFFEVWTELCEKGIIDSTTTPYDSFVGHLMSDHTDYNYIKANGWLIFANHLYMKWNVVPDENGNPTFEKVKSEEMAEVSQALEKLVNGILDNVPPEQFTDFVDFLDKYCQFTGITTIGKLTEYFSDNSINKILGDLCEFYNGTKEDGTPYLDPGEKEAFNKVLTEVLRDDNLEQFMIAWRQQLESSGQEDALELAQKLKNIEPFYPAITGMLQTVDGSELILAVGVINGYIESVGGFDALGDMSSTEMVLAFINYYNKLSPEEQENVRALLVDLFEMLGGAFENTSLREKGEIVNIIGGAAINGLESYAKNHPFIVAIGLLVIAVIASNPIGQWCIRVASSIMSVLVAVAVIAALWLEFKDDLYNAYVYVRDQVIDFMERMVELIESAINKLKNLVKTIIEYIKNKVTEVKEAGKYIVKEKVMEFSDTWSNLMPSPVLKLSAIITYALKNAYETANIHVEFDLGKLSRLVDRLSNAASNARSLESELDSFYSYLKNTKVKVDEKKEITLAKKYRISRNDLDPDKAGTLINASNRLSGAYAKLSRLDGTLLA